MNAATRGCATREALPNSGGRRGAHVVWSVLGVGIAVAVALASRAGRTRKVSQQEPVPAHACRGAAPRQARGSAPAGTSGRCDEATTHKARGRSAAEVSDGRNGHTRRWAEQRATARGRRSTIGPLFDQHLPHAAVGMGDGDGPRREGLRSGGARGGRRVGPHRFGPHRVGPYDVECVRAVLTQHVPDGEVGGLGLSVPGGAPAAVVERDPAIARRLDGVPDQIGRGTTVGVPVGQHDQGRCEAVATDVGDFPGLGAGAREVGGERASQDGAAPVPFAIRADQDERGPE